MQILLNGLLKEVDDRLVIFTHRYLGEDYYIYLSMPNNTVYILRQNFVLPVNYDNIGYGYNAVQYDVNPRDYEDRLLRLADYIKEKLKYLSIKQDTYGGIDQQCIEPFLNFMSSVWSEGC